MQHEKNFRKTDFDQNTKNRRVSRRTLNHPVNSINSTYFCILIVHHLNRNEASNKRCVHGKYVHYHFIIYLIWVAWMHHPIKLFWNLTPSFKKISKVSWTKNISSFPMDFKHYMETSKETFQFVVILFWIFANERIDGK